MAASLETLTYRRRVMENFENHWHRRIKSDISWLADFWYRRFSGDANTTWMRTNPQMNASLKHIFYWYDYDTQRFLYRERWNIRWAVESTVLYNVFDWWKGKCYSFTKVKISLYSLVTRLPSYIEVIWIHPSEWGRKIPPRCWTGASSHCTGLDNVFRHLRRTSCRQRGKLRSSRTWSWPFCVPLLRICTS